MRPDRGSSLPHHGRVAKIEEYKLPTKMRQPQRRQYATIPGMTCPATTKRFTAAISIVHAIPCQSKLIKDSQRKLRMWMIGCRRSKRRTLKKFACSVSRSLNSGKHYLSFNSASNSSSFRRILGKNIFVNVCCTLVRCAESVTSEGLTVTSSSRSSSSP